jgi:hypothetical protein
MIALHEPNNYSNLLTIYPMFDIDPVTLSLSFLLFGALCTPFIYHSLKNSKKRKALEVKLHELASQKNGHISQSEFWRNFYAIGLDQENKLLAYLRNNGEPLVFLIDLQQVKSAKIHKIAREVKSDASKRIILDYVGIELSYLQEGSKPTVLEFFDAELFTDLNGESVIAESWLESIQNTLKKDSEVKPKSIKNVARALL